MPAVNGVGFGLTEAGQRISYTVSYENIGGSDAHDVAIIDALHPDLDDSTLEIEDGGEYDADARTLTWIDPVVPPNTPRDVHFSIQVRGDAELGTRVKNAATIVFPDADPPTRIDTNPVEHVIPLPAYLPEPDLLILSCEDGGAPDTFTVNLMNQGTGFAYNATATIVDAPDGFEVVDDSCAFAHPTDADPAALSIVIPGAYTRSIDTVALRAPTDVDDPCAQVTWAIRYVKPDGEQVDFEVVGTGQGAGGGDSDSGGTAQGEGTSGCGCTTRGADDGRALLAFGLGLLVCGRRRAGPQIAAGRARL